ncbi:NPCBM/NEW2 domain-containing protein [Clostridium paraputrificum]|uniref:NPCBM/NEW2 domain-containing protein n=1 Tax=Clostridium TaxID=1485 RepID=UPI0011CBAA18|nr:MULTISPECIES: NPCBM/NEW2 domain-containing protein [Clostridium]MDB2087739.1 NPCBM/NEW2 domain-containing protein [Clostridium paraputrificum]MDB2094760.1 NPCBM/NEW2 domain-containing protein [Clostridium paraputrificum]MDU1178240.1 NPCBM/NEW2 domain-containing protein [Clostridium sp.]MDU1225439.1 NPCBM/NEW2 domain-containing protein [Clostridium sp.]MDU4317704.1 NPCBM/NEW2 domain-containing protein [Clostridium sp.]
MNKRKIAAIMATAVILNFSAPSIQVLADEISSNLTLTEGVQSTKATISKFELLNSSNIAAYDEVFKMDNSNIDTIATNGGNYNSASAVEKAIDGDFSTHWETGKQNSSDFTNEVVFKFKELTDLNRIVYAARQSSAKGKGFAKEIEIYGSITDEEDDFRLISGGEYTGSTGDVVEIRFNKTTFKRIKFVFKEANQNWASASEFIFYKEDKLSDKMKTLFTDDTMSKVNEEFNTIEKISALEEEAKKHPLYSIFKEDIENAKILLEENKIEPSTVKVSRLEAYHNGKDSEYSKFYRMPNSNIVNVSANGGVYPTTKLEYMLDDNPDTHWETRTNNTENFTNEVIFTLDKPEVLNRIAFLARDNRKGFPEKFEIYASETTKGDTFQLVATGSAQSTNDFLEFKFQPTKFKRIKFKFVKAYIDRPFVAEFRFYKEDKVSDKIANLFTDATMSKVSEEFNTIEKLDALENEAKDHPLYEEFKEYIENAEILLQENRIEATTAITKRFEEYSNGEYSSFFKMDNSNIKGIKNNGRHYASQVIANAIDDNLDTYWETNTYNTNEFTNEVEVEFNEVIELNRIVYGARKSDNKGFAKEFEIYASTTSAGETYQLVATGKHDKVSGLVEAKFNPTKFKRVKFKFKNSDQNWATLSEIAFYKQDKVADKVESLFTNGLMNKLSEDFNTEEKLQALKDETNGHPLESTFRDSFEIANKILNGKLETVKVITAEQHGDMVAHANKNLKFGFGNNNQPTGISAKPGDEITVYVDADPSQPMPKLAFSQQEGSFANWMRTVNLNAGKNVITVPDIAIDSWYNHDVTRGGSIYIINPYTPEEQSKAPVIRFESGNKYPFLTENTNVDEFKDFLIEYKKAIDEDIAKNSNVLDREVLDVFEFVSDHIVWTGTATGAYEAYIEQGANPLDTVNRYNNHMKELFRYYGLDGRNEQNDPKFIRENVRLAQPFGYMYAYTNHIGVQGDVMTGLLVGDPGWGLNHEIGHRMDVSARLYGEVTNNMLPMYMSAYYNNIDNRIPYENEVYKNVISENSNRYSEGELAENLAVFWQLEMYKPGYWGELNSIYRERNVNLGNENPDNAKMQYLVKFSSEVVGEDLSEYFARHGFEVNDETREETSQYPRPDKKIWYLNNSKINYKGNGFTQETDLDVTLSRVENGIKLGFSVNNNVKSDLLGYEIFRDGELIGFTSTSSFVDTNADMTKNSRYEVIPYDINLGTGDAVSIYSFAPSISIQQGKITLELREEFDPMAYIKGLSYEGNDITSRVEVTHNVDISKRGIYQLKYKLEDEGIVSEKLVEVEVVSDYEYLSDEEWVSVETQWGTPRRNLNIKGRVNGDVKDFEKGFGIHANGTITYDLSGKEYDNFEVLLGVDGGISAQNHSSLKFEIIGDGNVLANTEVLKHADNMVYVNVPVNGVEQLVIKVADAGNGNTSDHGVIANPKLTTNNAKPVIKVEDKIYKLGEDVDFMSGIEAIDAEDYDLTSSVKIVSNNYEEGKIGRFEVVYRVTDSDNNTVDKKAYVTIYEDFIVNKSKFGQFDRLNEYNEEFKIPVASVTNNGGNYPHSFIDYAIDGNPNTHWETYRQNSDTFKNEVIFDLGESKEISRVSYKARNGGKGFARKFEIYISNEAEGNDFILAGKGEYTGNVNDVIDFKINKTTARRVMFKFIEANQNWASIGEVAFYKEDTLADKVNSLFTDNSKTEVTESYNTLDNVQALREEVKEHPAANLFEEDLVKAEEIIRAKFPTIDVEDITYIKLNSEFDLSSGVTANDQEDGNITNKVTIYKRDFNVSRPGKYTLTYSVTDNDGNIITKDRKVVVYSESNYLSDLDWASAVSGWKKVNKDSAVNLSEKIKLNVNGEIKEFDKGIGAATNAEIVYELDGNYTNFSTYLGTDKNYDDNRTTIIFKIFADGEEVYSSDVIRKDSEAEFVNLDVTGVKELKLVADDADKNGLGDFASWADPKVYTTNAKPELTIPKSLSTKLGDEINLNEAYSAIDTEDGDITDKVEVSGKVNFNKTGKYPITYKVTDSDGNKVVKTRTIAVVDMNDYSYLTDYDWNAAQYNYTVPKKDISISGNTLRLTDENGEEVSFERGVGAHSTSTITYDLTDKDYVYFSSYVGVDRGMYNTVGSVSFEVYIDGEKKFDSGLMTSKEPMKYLEVDINGAKELKLVVTDGGNGNGSDHGTWGDSKLHFAKDAQGNYEELESLVNEVKNYEQDIYSEESFKVLQEALKKAEEMLADKISIQDEIKLMVDELKISISNLEERVDLNEIITIKDKSLKDSIKRELKLSSDNITIGDMYKLTRLSVVGSWISSLEGLQYAKNLEELDISYNEIKDLSPLKNLKKLTNLNGNPQIITEGMLYAKDNTITLDYRVLNRNGERLKPREIIIRSNKTFEVVDLTLEELVDENGVIFFDVSNLDKAVYSMYIVYEDKVDNFLSQSLYMFDVK